MIAFAAERLWRSLKYEDVYLKGYVDGREVARGIAEWIAFYNERRPHQALVDRAPMATIVSFDYRISGQRHGIVSRAASDGPAI